MLEKLDDPRFQRISRPATHAVDLLRRVLLSTGDPTVCEVGIGIGATSVELCRALDNRGTIFFFDFEDKLAELATDLARLGFSNFVMRGNQRKLFASYSWELGKLLLEVRRKGRHGLFDLVYLDGAHAFHHDAPAAAVLKELLKPGGYILLDDYDWSFARSGTQRPSVRPEVARDYTEEQIEACHVERVCALFFDADPSFQKTDLGYRRSEHRRAYRKAPPGGETDPRAEPPTPPSVAAPEPADAASSPAGELAARTAATGARPGDTIAARREIASLREALARRQGEVASLRAELFALTRQLSSTRATLDLAINSMSWKLTAPLRAIAAASRSWFPRLRGGTRAVAYMIPRLLARPPQDLRTNRDVEAAGIDPLLHYLSRGAREGGDPGPAFRTASYLERHPEVAASRLNTVMRWLIHAGDQPVAATPRPDGGSTHDHGSGSPRRATPAVAGVTVISADVGGDDGAQSLAIAEALSADHRVQLIGFRFTARDCRAAVGTGRPPIPGVVLDGSDFPAFGDAMARALARVTGDLLLVVKPHLPSLGLALLANYHFGTPIALVPTALQTSGGRRPGSGPRGMPVALGEVDPRSPGLLNPLSDQWSRIMHGLAAEIPPMVDNPRSSEVAQDLAMVSEQLRRYPRVTLPVSTRFAACFAEFSEWARSSPTDAPGSPGAVNP